MQSAPPTVESVFSRSWDLLRTNWVIIVPGLVIGFIVGVIQYFLTPQYSPDTGVTGAVGGMAAGFLTLLVTLVGQILAQCYTTGMAGAAWLKGTTDLSDGSRAFQRDAGNTFVAIIGLAIAIVIAAILAPFTLGISILLYVYFFIYTFPAAIIGERPGFAAMGDSFRIASKRVGPTLIIVVLLAVIAVIGGIISVILHFIPFLGPIVGAMLAQAVLAYATLVIVGEYLALRDVSAPTSPTV
jgi:hypothetical protein